MVSGVRAERRSTRVYGLGLIRCDGGDVNIAMSGMS